PLVDARFTPDGRKIVAADTAGDVRVFEARSGQPAAPRLRADGPFESIGVSPDGRRFLTAGLDGVRVRSLGGPSAARSIEIAGTAHQAEFSPDGRRIAIASDSGQGRVVDSASGTPVG